MTNLIRSRQIRPPIYSMKQSKLRRRRVIRFAILYFVLLVVFLALLVGPAVAGKYLDSITKTVNGLMPDFNLVQPNGQNHDDTRSNTATGTGAATYSWPSSSGGGKAKATASGRGKIKLF